MAKAGAMGRVISLVDTAKNGKNGVAGAVVVAEVVAAKEDAMLMMLKIWSVAKRVAKMMAKAEARLAGEKKSGMDTWM